MPFSMYASAGWQRYVQRTAGAAARHLGIPDSVPVQVQLYKMMLYSSGDHFVPHRDTEKAPNMFATLTILLPSQYQVPHKVWGHGACWYRLRAGYAFPWPVQSILSLERRFAKAAWLLSLQDL